MVKPFGVIERVKPIICTELKVDLTERAPQTGAGDTSKTNITEIQEVQEAPVPVVKKKRKPRKYRPGERLLKQLNKQNRQEQEQEQEQAEPEPEITTKLSNTLKDMLDRLDV